MTSTPIPADSSLHSAFCRLHSAVGPLLPYKSGRRISRGTGETVFIFEFKLKPPSQETAMNTIESFVTNAIIKALHKSAPAMTADDDAKVTKAVTDFVTTTMDLVAVYFAIRNAKK